MGVWINTITDARQPDDCSVLCCGVCGTRYNRECELCVGITIRNRRVRRVGTLVARPELRYRIRWAKIVDLTLGYGEPGRKCPNRSYRHSRIGECLGVTSSKKRKNSSQTAVFTQTRHCATCHSR